MPNIHVEAVIPSRCESPELSLVTDSDEIDMDLMTETI
jgi:hypothetical protein